jgi:uncharacterized protein
MAYSREETLGYVQARERNILRNVYLWMTAGLALTGVVARTVSTSPAIMSALLGNTFLFFGLIIGQLALVIMLSARIHKMSASSATFAFAGYAILNGITLSIIFLAYTGQTIALAFFTTAATFGGMSLWALVTKKDLSGMGHYLMMGLWGLIIASLVNMFLRSEAAYYLISYVGIAVFLGLTAYDTQIIKKWNDSYGSSMDETQYIKLSIMGALKLYLDFINIFLFMLRLFGRRN